MLGLGCDRGESTHIVIGTTGLTIVVVGLVLGRGVGVAVVDVVVRWVDVCRWMAGFEGGGRRRRVVGWVVWRIWSLVVYGCCWGRRKVV